MKPSEYNGNHIAREPHYKKVKCPLCDGKGIVDVEQIKKYWEDYSMNFDLLKEFADPTTDDWKDGYEGKCPLCESDGYIEEVK